MDVNKWLSIITGAAVAGLVILNYQGATAIFNAGSSFVTSYVKTVQGR